MTRHDAHARTSQLEQRPDQPGNGTVSTIGVKTRKKHPDHITIGTGGAGVAVTPDVSMRLLR
jgi:hypothetical protein